MQDPRILFEDTHLVVLSKAAGMLSQGDISGEESLVDYLRKYFGRNYVGLIHRLDRNTSGIMVVAKRSKAANRLTESLQKGDLERTYLAIVEGDAPETKRLEDYLLKNETTNEVRVVNESTSTKNGAKKAVLSFKRIAKSRLHNKVISAIHVTLETGRGHQIRVQCSHAGYPLLGDRKYGSHVEEPGRPALHSYSLKFPHPMSGEVLEFKDPLPSELLGLLPKDTQWP